jgi:hypothetical protein
VKRMLGLLLVLFVPARVAAAPEDAVVEMPSHGGSATVIYSVQGKTFLLSCGHCFGSQADRQKRIEIVAPSPAPNSNPVRTGGIKLLAVDAKTDLSLLEMGYGPLPYVCPVASVAPRPGLRALSVGYDEMKLPPQKRPATIVENRGVGWDVTLTTERPWHGRSGGALIDPTNGTLVGVVSAYTGPPNHRELQSGANGVYVSHAAIVRFLQPYSVALHQPVLGDDGFALPMPYAPEPQAQAPAPAPALPYLDIAPENRVRNRTGAQCVWASLETLARHWVIAACYDLTARHGGTSSPGEVAAVLSAKGVRFTQSTRDRSKQALIGAARYGCLVGLGGQHAICCVGANETAVWMIDNSGPDAGHIREWSWPTVLSRWDGWTCTLYPPSSDNAPQQQPSPQRQAPSPFAQPFAAPPSPRPCPS